MTLYSRYYYEGGGGVTTFPTDYNVVPPVEVTPRLAPNASPGGLAIVLALVAEVGTGRILGEVQPQFRRVLWMLGNNGEAEMVFAADDPAVLGGMVSPGRRVMLQFDNGLPDWGGVLDVPIDRDGWTVGVRAYEPTHLLKGRLTGRNSAVQTDAGHVAAALIAETNAEDATGITVDFVDAIVGDVAQTYHLARIGDVLANDVAPYAEWVVRPHLSAAGLMFRMYMAPRLGRDLSARVRLVQGVNMMPPKIVEQGPIVNQWIVVGNAGDWDPAAATPRAVAVATDSGSQYRYGLRQDTATADQDDETNLGTLAAAAVAGTAEPYVALRATVLNLPPATFGQYDVGDWITVELHGGYAGKELVMRVVGRELDVESGTCEVILK